MSVKMRAWQCPGCGHVFAHGSPVVVSGGRWDCPECFQAYPAHRYINVEVDGQDAPDHEATARAMASRLESMERIVMQQQEALNNHAEVITKLQRRVRNLEVAGALYGCGGK